MWWIVGIVAILFYYKMEDIVKTLNKKDPEYQKRKNKENQIEIEEKYELIMQLKANIGTTVTIKSYDLIHTNLNDNALNMSELTGKILEVDEDWINLEYKTKKFMKKDHLNHFIFRSDSIKSFTSLP